MKNQLTIKQIHDSEIGKVTIVYKGFRGIHLKQWIFFPSYLNDGEWLSANQVVKILEQETENADRYNRVERAITYQRFNHHQPQEMEAATA